MNKCGEPKNLRRLYSTNDDIREVVNFYKRSTVVTYL